MGEIADYYLEQAMCSEFFDPLYFHQSRRRAANAHEKSKSYNKMEAKFLKNLKRRRKRKSK